MSSPAAAEAQRAAAPADAPGAAPSAAGRPRLALPLPGAVKLKVPHVETRVTPQHGKAYVETRATDGAFERSPAADSSADSSASAGAGAGGCNFVVDSAPDRELHRVLEGLYISAVDGAEDAAALVRADVTHVLNLSPFPPAFAALEQAQAQGQERKAEGEGQGHIQGQEGQEGEGLRYLCLAVEDTPEADIARLFPQVFEFVHAARGHGRATKLEPEPESDAPSAPSAASASASASASSACASEKERKDKDNAAPSSRASQASSSSSSSSSYPSSSSSPSSSSPKEEKSAAAAGPGAGAGAGAEGEGDAAAQRRALAEHLRRRPRDKPGNVLVHCHAGVSRSASAVLAYLMRACGVSLDAALAHLRRVRPAAQPNPGFRRQLRAYEAELRRQGVIPAQPQGQGQVQAEGQGQQQQQQQEQEQALGGGGGAGAAATAAAGAAESKA